MATSQNGWSLISSTQLNKNPFPGTNVVPLPGIRKDRDVVTILHYVGTQFNNRVERLENIGCWGYSRRYIGGTKTWSNHASGTAIDLNAPRHPMGKTGTFSPAQVSEIKKILKECSGVVRWGGEYRDEMHFEINASASAVAKAAAKLLAPQKIFLFVREGEGLSSIAKRAGYRDWFAPTAWIRLSRLNGYGLNWQKLNASLKRGQQIRVK